MKKILYVLIVALLSGCLEEVMQKGVVMKVESDKSFGYKYTVTVYNIQKAGIGGSRYILHTDYNYRAGDTITIK